MFWELGAGPHGLAHDPFKAIVAPRPIGWIGSRSAAGIDNLAPYSFFNALYEDPKLVMFASDGIKDSARNVAETGCFTCSMVSEKLAAAMNVSSATVAPDVDEFALAGLAKGEGRLVAAPFVAEALAVLECRLTGIVRPQDLAGNPVDCHMVIGQVVGIHISPAIIRDGLVDLALAAPVTRLGYRQYAAFGEIFEMQRPKVP